MGYWLFDELPPAQEMNRQWNEAAAMVEPIRANWRPVVVSERAEDFWYVGIPLRPIGSAQRTE